MFAAGVGEVMSDRGGADPAVAVQFAESRGGGCTVAVLAGGIDCGYPAGHVGLLKRIATSGAVVSEYPPGVPPARHRFLQRHRLLAAISRSTVVIEAGRRSGARHAARLVAELGRPVLAVPGPVSSAVSAGCHRLIQDGTARLVVSVDDVIAVIDESEGTTPIRRRLSRRMWPAEASARSDGGPHLALPR